ncbi:hypothetical protein ACHQM5_015629 [Ranunculus cassubicifolius]
MEKKKLSDVITPILRGLIFCILGCIFFIAGFHSCIKHPHDHSNVSTIITGGLIFICLGLFVFILGGLVIYCECSRHFNRDEGHELDLQSEKSWFIVFMVSMMFLSISGLLTIIWGILNIVYPMESEAEVVMNMLMVMFVGLLIFLFPIGLFLAFLPTIKGVSKISPDNSLSKT